MNTLRIACSGWGVWALGDLAHWHAGRRVAPPTSSPVGHLIVWGAPASNEVFGQARKTHQAAEVQAVAASSVVIAVPGAAIISARVAPGTIAVKAPTKAPTTERAVQGARQADAKLSQNAVQSTAAQQRHDDHEEQLDWVAARIDIELAQKLLDLVEQAIDVAVARAALVVGGMRMRRVGAAGATPARLRVVAAGGAVRRARGPEPTHCRSALSRGRVVIEGRGGAHVTGGVAAERDVQVVVAAVWVLADDSIRGGCARMQREPVCARTASFSCRALQQL